MIVPSTPGGGTDLATRIVTAKLAEWLGQQIVIDNRGGASGNLGAEPGARAAPDGYTLTAAIASLTSNASLMKKVPYGIERDFAAISQTVAVPNLILGDNYEVTVADLEGALAKQNLKLLPGDAVILHTGWGKLWGKDNARYGRSNPGIGTHSNACIAFISRL